MTRKNGTSSGHQAEQGVEPAVIDLGLREHILFDGLTEATVKIEAPEVRRSREKRIDQQAVHERHLDFMRLAIAGIVLIGFLGLSIYLLAFRPDATENQQILALVGAMASGGGVYAFGSKTKKPS